MGATLPKAVESTVVERHGCNAFRVAVAEMNGWRNSMEDAHLIHTCSDWGFFGVFDGHGGGQCSAFVANKLRQELEEKGCPKDDAEIKSLILGVDQAFLDTETASGSTATMCFVHKPTCGGKYQLCVVNAGDSRVLLCKRDGSIVDGGGTDQGLTTDHKPSHPAERARIYRCGGHVEEAAGGIARVNGDLAVSRGFGDAEYKKTGGPGPEDRPVTADPEIKHFECDETDIVVLCCDGVSEGNFPNPEVVQLVAEIVREKNDLGLAAREVCHKAVECNSKDNVTCMVVTLTGSDTPEAEIEFNPGPLAAPTHKGFMTAYEAMAKKANLTMVQAAELRYDRLCEELEAKEVSPDKLEALQQEKAKFGKPEGVKGSEERSAWFQQWLLKLPEQHPAEESGSDGPDPDMIMRMLMARPGGQV